MTLPIRIEKDEIPFFIAGCAVEAIQWEVEGMRYEEWRAERERGDDPSATWRDEIVIPYLQRRFEALEVHEDGRLFGIRHSYAINMVRNGVDIRRLQQAFQFQSINQA